MAVQIVFDVLVLRSLLEGSADIYNLGKLLGIVIIFIPFLVKQLFFIGQRDSSPFTVLGECSALSYSQLFHDKEEILYRIDKLIAAGHKLSKENLQEIIHDLPRHSSFSYINSGSLTNNYFEQAEKTLYDGYVYLVITKSKSASSEVIGLFTNKQYNHVSLSFDKDLNTIISYSQFVYSMLELAGLNYFEKDAVYVTPADFVELDYYRSLDFICRIDLSKPGPKNGEETNGKRET